MQSKDILEGKAGGASYHPCRAACSSPCLGNCAPPGKSHVGGAALRYAVLAPPKWDFAVLGSLVWGGLLEVGTLELGELGIEKIWGNECYIYIIY